jgi:amidase
MKMPRVYGGTRARWRRAPIGASPAEERSEQVPVDPLDPFIDASAQAHLVREGLVSPLELVDAAIARIEQVDPELNAVVHECFDQARREAAGPLPDGPFRGVPYLQKDLDLTTAGEPYHAGTRFLRDRHHRAERDSTLSGLMRASGLVLLGRTNTPELGLTATTEPESTGPTVNPWAPTHSAGGSSGGAAAAVAAGLVAVAHASDGGGSIRVPASACGVVGLKPTRGRVSAGPDVGEAWAGLGIDGVVTRSVRDTALALDVMAAPAVGDPYVAPPPTRPFAEEPGADTGLLRVGVRWDAPSGGRPTHPDCVAAVRMAASLLEDLGHVVNEDGPAALDDEGLAEQFIECFTVWVARELDRLGEMAGEPVPAHGVEAATWFLAETGRSVPASRYLAALDRLHRFTREVSQWWADGFDILVTPTIGEPPPPLGSFSPTVDDPLHSLARSAEVVAFTAPFNTTGQPAISLPLFWTAQGLPIGVQFVAAHGREDLLLRLAAHLEVLCPWDQRRPPLRAPSSAAAGAPSRSPRGATAPA